MRKITSRISRNISISSLGLLRNLNICKRKQTLPLNHPFLIAHRGASGSCPENTVAAFDQSLEMKADYIELDIQLSLDGELVVIHDTSLVRTTNGTGNVKDLTFAELSALDAGSWFDSKFQNERIQPLTKILSLYTGKIGLIIELKQPSLYPGIEHKLAHALRTVPLKHKSQSPIIVQSFDQISLMKFHRIEPEIAIGVLVRGFPRGLRHKDLRDMKKYAQFVCLKVTMATPRLIKKIKSYKLGVIVWTINDLRTFERVKHQPIDGLVTDYPNLFQ